MFGWESSHSPLCNWIPSVALRIGDEFKVPYFSSPTYSIEFWSTLLFTLYLGYHFDFSGQQSLKNLLYSLPLVSVIINSMILHLWHLWTHHNPLHPLSQGQALLPLLGLILTGHSNSILSKPSCTMLLILILFPRPPNANQSEPLVVSIYGWEAGRFDLIPEVSRIGQAWLWISYRAWGNT